MKGKLTLITPPDIFENSNLSILLCHLTDEEQDAVGRWLQLNDVEQNINLYAYAGEPNTVWFLYALNRCEYKYINLDCVNLMTQSLSGYILSRNNVFYRTDNKNLSAIYSHINTNNISKIEDFLESILGGQTTTYSQL